MRIIYDDIIYSLQKSGGGSVYWTEIIKRFKEYSEHYVYDNAHENFFYDDANLPQPHILSSNFLPIKRYFNVKLKHHNLPFIFHSSLYRLCRNNNAINITTVHDFTYEYYRKDWKSNFHKNQKKNSVINSDGVICISENTKQDLLKFYPEFHGRIKVIYNGYSTDKYFFNPNVQKTKNILYVGARTDYKRFDFAIELVSLLPECQLIIVGGGSLNRNEKNLLNQKLLNRYLKKDNVSDEALCELYNSAFFLCYPSEYEGFGIPIIEAQACGCPVVCQPKSSIPEVVNGTAVFINSNDLNGSILNIRQLFNSAFYKDIQFKGLANAKRFSWDKCANEVKSFYEEVYNDVTKH